MMTTTRRVTGVGGIFFKSDNPEKLYAWYEQHLGIQRAPDGTGTTFEWRDAEDADKKGMTVWSIFPRNTKYLEALKKEGVQVDPHREDYDYGRFAWIMDPDGNRIELWEPPKGK